MTVMVNYRQHRLRLTSFLLGMLLPQHRERSIDTRRGVCFRLPSLTLFS